MSDLPKWVVYCEYSNDWSKWTSTAWLFFDTEEDADDYIRYTEATCEKMPFELETHGKRMDRDQRENMDVLLAQQRAMRFK